MAPDVRGLSRRFDYLVPPTARQRVAVGTEVRIDLHGRRVGGWVTDVDVEPVPGVPLRELAKVRGAGPSAEVMELAEWAAWRWAGPLSAFLRAASAPAAVTTLPASTDPPRALALPLQADERRMLDEALSVPTASTLRFAPATDRYPLIASAVSRALCSSPGPRSVLVVCPGVVSARRLAARLRRDRLPVALLADDGPATAQAAQWAMAAAGGSTVVGARAAAWAPAPGLALVVVVDEHDESMQSERSPTWNARDVALERARRSGVPALLLSPCPSLEALEVSRLVVPDRSVERGGWPVLDVADRRDEDPATASSLISPQLAHLLSEGGRVVCVLNRAGRARLLACRSCGDLCRCEVCGASVGQNAAADLVCRRCQAVRPAVCASCGSGALKVLRAGVGRMRDDLAAMVGEPVDEVTALSGDAPSTRVVIGTEAVLHRMSRADVVAYCDIDQELTAPRFRAAEQALALIARGARLVGGRAGGGRVLIQTRLAEHPVVQAALHGDPGRVSDAERALRSELRFPPVTAMAVISGDAAPPYAEALGASQAEFGLEVIGPLEGRWLVRAPDHSTLADGLARVARPPGRLRVEVDPLRI